MEEEEEGEEKKRKWRRRRKKKKRTTVRLWMIRRTPNTRKRGLTRESDEGD